MLSSGPPTASTTYTETLQRLAVPAVCTLIAFLSYGSQIVFHWLAPGPLSRKETIWINILIICIWTTYYKAVTTDPGRLPKNLKEQGIRDIEREKNGQPNWCRKCDAVKPPRSHHCKICKRCIPKMDHHCPWTANCTSARTLPPFLRFLFYTVCAMLYFATVLYQRVVYFWNNSNKSWQGVDEAPLWSIIWLFVVCVITAITLFILTVLLVTSVQSLLLNTTMIEQWEIQRHSALVRRAKKNGGYVSTPGGGELRIAAQEFPYDVGIWTNIVQGMGSSNPLVWLLPWGGGPSNDEVWSFETNGFEEEGDIWPPPDPEKIPQPKWVRRDSLGDGGFALGKSAQYGDDRVVTDFKRRQEADYAKKGLRSAAAAAPSNATLEGSYEWLELAESDESTDDDSDLNHEKIKVELKEEYDGTTESRYGWRNEEGERLADYGVDEDAEGIDAEVLDEEEEKDKEEDDLPLSELIRRRRGGQVRAK